MSHLWEPDRWGDRPMPQGERLARLEVVAGHLEASQRSLTARQDHQGEAMSRIFARLDRQDRAMEPVKAALARLDGVPERLAEQDAAAARRRRSKEDAKELRREAIAMVQWLVTIALAVAVAAGWVAPEAFKAIAPVLAPGK